MTGDVARRLERISDAEWLELVLLRIVPAHRFLALDPPPRPRRGLSVLRPAVGDIARRLEVGGRARELVRELARANRRPRLRLVP